MSQSEKDRRAALLTGRQAPGEPERKSGRAVFDDGRTVWEWQTATGVFERHVSDEQLSRLEASDLCLVEQSPQAKEAGQAIYGSRPVSRSEIAVRRTPAPRPQVGAFRQLLRRLVPAG
ncbi:MAG: hypothetical protein ABW171_14735 [Steroidobacter sp.]